MRTLVFIISNLFAMQAFSNEIQFCQKQIRKLEKKWKATSRWHKQRDHYYLRPTTELGSWIALVERKSTVTLSKVSQLQEIAVQFKKSNCQSVLKVKKNKPVQGRDDQDLLKLISNKKGILYIWSTRMPLSVKGFLYAKQAAESMGMEFIPIFDPNAKSSEITAEIRQVVGANADMKFNSLELIIRRAYQHFPTLIGFENNQLTPTQKYGYEKVEMFKKDIAELFTLK